MKMQLEEGQEKRIMYIMVNLALERSKSYLEKPDRQLQREWMAVVKDVCSSDLDDFFFSAGGTIFSADCAESLDCGGYSFTTW